MEGSVVISAEDGVTAVSSHHTNIVSSYVLCAAHVTEMGI